MELRNNILSLFKHSLIMSALLVCFTSMAFASPLEFDLEPATDYEVEINNNLLNISFSTPSAKKMNKLKSPLSNLFTDKTISADLKKITLTATTPLKIQHHREDNKLIIDVEPQNSTLQSQGLDKTVSKDRQASPHLTLEYGDHNSFARFVFATPQKIQYQVSNDDTHTTIHFNKKWQINSMTLQNYPQSDRITKLQNSDGSMDIRFPASLIQTFQLKNKIILDLSNNVINSAIENTSNDIPNSKIEIIDTPKIKPVEIGASTTVIKNAHMTLSQIIPQDNENKISSLSFSWNIPVNLSVFLRGKYIWAVFDHRQALDVQELKETAGNLASEVIQLPHPNATVLRVKPTEGVKPFIRKEGLLWIIDLIKKDLPQQTEKGLTIFTQYDGLKHTYLYIPSPSTGNTITIIDPEIGDLVSISPTSDLKSNISSPYSYPDFDLLSSLQGVVMIFKTHDIILGRTNSGLTIKAPGRSLNISPDIETLKRQALLSSPKTGQPNFILDLPADIFKYNFIEAQQKLSDDITQAPKEQKDEARLLLVKYYLSKGLGTNALSILEKMWTDKSPLVNSERFQGMLGVANFLTHRYALAVENFSFGNLPNYNEAIFWRTLSSAAIEPKKEDNVVLLSYISLIRDYPDEIKNRIALIGANIALAAGDDMSTQNFIDILKTGEQKDDYSDAISYLTAQKYILQGYPRNAVRELKNTTKSKSLKYTSLARKQLIQLETDFNAIKLNRAIGELERLRFAWGEIEFRKDLLRMLANLYVKNNDYYNSMRSLQKLLSLSDEEEQENIIHQMVALFEEIYLENRADNLPALKSLALYHDFEWLASKSEHYNTIVQKLSDRLVAVDLVDRASLLLHQQLKFGKLSAEERGGIGARLALIYLFNNQSNDALKILDETISAPMSETLQLHRKIIRAKALANNKKTDESLTLLKNDYSKNALLLKTDIYWNSGRWGEAADTIKYLIEKPEKNQKLTDEQMSFILDWATALKNAGRETVIVRLRNTFKPYFKDTKYYSTFNILTNHLEKDKIDLKSIDSVVNDIAAYSNFSKIYTNSLRTEDLTQDKK